MRAGSLMHAVPCSRSIASGILPTILMATQQYGCVAHIVAFCRRQSSANGTKNGTQRVELGVHGASAAPKPKGVRESSVCRASCRRVRGHISSMTSTTVTAMTRPRPRPHPRPRPRPHPLPRLRQRRDPGVTTSTIWRAYSALSPRRRPLPRRRPRPRVLLERLPRRRLPPWRL